MELDAIDRRIIEKLTSDARIPLIQVSKDLNVSNTLVHQRIKKLKEKGILKEATYTLDPVKLGYNTAAFTSIKIDTYESRKDIENELAKISEIVECVNISGEYAFHTKIFALSNKHLRDIIYDKIQTIKGVSTTSTIIAFETTFERKIPLEMEWLG